MIDEPIPTALYVDFDNVFGNLYDADPRAAYAFATKPLEWLKFFEDGLHADAPESARKRSILVRRCYLNPAGSIRRDGTTVYYSNFRRPFADAAFSVVDCPSLTQAGKSAADTVMIMEILDGLRHETRFGEFVVMSGDADFTPVLLRLRAHNRRISVVTPLSIARAYRAAADIVVPQDRFAIQALGIVEAPPPAPVPVPVRAPAPAIALGEEKFAGLEGDALLATLAAETRTYMAERDFIDPGELVGAVYRRFPQFADPRETARWFGLGSAAAVVRAIVGIEPGLALLGEPARLYRSGTDTALRVQIVAMARTLLIEKGAEFHLAHLGKEVRKRLPALGDMPWPGGAGLRQLLVEGGGSWLVLREGATASTVYVSYRDEAPVLEKPAPETPVVADVVEPAPPAEPIPLKTAILQAVRVVLRERRGEANLAAIGSDVRKYVTLPNGKFPGPGLKALLETCGDPNIRLRTAEDGSTIYVYDPTYADDAEPPIPEPVPEPLAPSPHADILQAVREILSEQQKDVHLSQLNKAVRARVAAIAESGWPEGLSLRAILEQSGDPAIGLKQVGARNTVYAFAAEPPAALAGDALLAAVAAGVCAWVGQHGGTDLAALPDAVYRVFPQFAESTNGRPWFGLGSSQAAIQAILALEPDLYLVGDPRHVASRGTDARLTAEILRTVSVILDERGGKTPLRGLATEVKRRIPELGPWRSWPGVQSFRSLLANSGDARIRIASGGDRDAATVFDPGSFAPSVDAPGPETTDPESAS